MNLRQILFLALFPSLLVPSFSDKATLETSRISGLKDTTEVSKEHVNVGERGKERLDIVYQFWVSSSNTIAEVKEIDSESRIIVGDLSHLGISCESSENKSIRGSWSYHGLQREDVVQQGSDRNLYLNLSLGPPVFRMECKLREEGVIRLRNSTLIYTGDGTPPFLHNGGRPLKSTVLNGTTALFPCLLSYPLSSNKELQLYKDGKLISKGNPNLQYVPEYGYYLNFGGKNPLGSYQCKVTNSTEDDELTMQLAIENFVVVKHARDLLPSLHTFFENDPRRQQYTCSVPETLYQNKFEWRFLLKDGSYLPIQTKRSTKSSPAAYKSQYWDNVKITFPSENIIGVVCAVHAKSAGDSVAIYSSFVPVQIKKAQKPNILKDSLRNIFVYKENLELTCRAWGNPVTWRWRKDGADFNPKSQREGIIGSPIPSSTIVLPHEEDGVGNTYTCTASNFLGEVSHTFTAYKEKNWGNILSIVGGLIGVLLGILFVFIKIAMTPRPFDEALIRNFREGESPDSDSPEDNQPQHYLSEGHDDIGREINEKLLTRERLLCTSGQFGDVWLGRLRNEETGWRTRVAIKKPKANLGDLEFENFLKEIKLMAYIGFHRNIVGYIGSVTTGVAYRRASLVLEYCNVGNLHKYLWKMRSSFQDDIMEGYVSHRDGVIRLKSSDLMRFSLDISLGLEYIHSRGIVHRDLAARNILLTYEGPCGDLEESQLDPAWLVAKVADYGLSRNFKELNDEFYQSSPMARLPLRWLPVEAIATGRFTLQSDMWSLAVLFWEMFTLGELPHGESELNEGSIFNLVWDLLNGKMLAEPEHAPSELWALMQSCWNLIPLERPTATMIVKKLTELNDVIKRIRQIRTRQPAAVMESISEEESPSTDSGTSEMCDSVTVHLNLNHSSHPTTGQVREVQIELNGRAHYHPQEWNGAPGT